MVDRIIVITAAELHCSWEGARQTLVDRWTAEARDRIRQNSSTFLMYEEMAQMAEKAVKP